MKQKSEEEIRKSKRRFFRVQIVLFGMLMAAGTVLGALWMLRPQRSEREKRELTAFPEFTMESFLDGSFLGDISTWYADTFPLREEWIRVDQGMESLYGIRTSQILGGGDKTADEIPVIEMSSLEESVPEESSREDSVREESEVQESSAAEDQQEESLPEESEEEKPAIPDDPTQVQEAIQGQIQDGLFVHGDAAYSRYFFSLDPANRYIEMLNRVAGELAGQTRVYSVIIPDSTQIMLEEDLVEQLGGSSEKQAIDYYYGMLSDEVHTVDTFDTLYEHRDEYLYFRTDHHWTQLGAYYVYQNLAREMGAEPHALSQFEKVNFGEFLGSFYSTCGSEAMRNHPDFVEAYLPMGTNEMTFYTTEGEEYAWNVIRDVTDWDTYAKYSCFIGGDNPYSYVENPEIQDGSSCLLVKESFGNALAPFLVDHYQYVYIIDYRYYNENLLDFIREKKVDDLILANNVAILGSDYVAERLDLMFS